MTMLVSARHTPRHTPPGHLVRGKWDAGRTPYVRTRAIGPSERPLHDSERRCTQPNSVFGRNSR